MTSNNHLEINRTTFNQLDFNSKLKTVWNSGNFVDSHITSVGESRIINLYQLNEFHVEVVYTEIGTKVKKINCYQLGLDMQTYFPTGTLD